MPSSFGMANNSPAEDCTKAQHHYMALVLWLFEAGYNKQEATNEQVNENQ